MPFLPPLASHYVMFRFLHLTEIDHVCVCGAAVAVHFRLPHGLTKGAWPARQTDQTDDPLDIGHEFQITGSTISSNESRGRGTSGEFASFSTSGVSC